MYWEVFECARKVTLVGLLVFFGEGSTVQLTVGLIVCVLCIMLYNNLKPYDAWQNDSLQQAAQITIFLTLVSHIVTLASTSPDALEIDKAVSKNVVGNILICTTLITSVLAVPVAVLEVYPNPRHKLVDMKRQAFENARGSGGVLKSARKWITRASNFRGAIDTLKESVDTKLSADDDAEKV